MERGNTERAPSREQAPAQPRRNLGQAAMRGAETARRVDSAQPSAEQARALNQQPSPETIPTANRARNLGQKSIATALRPIPPTLNLNSFDKPALAAYYPPQEINADRGYIRRCQERYRDRDEDGEGIPSQARAKQFEMMFLYGVQRNAWLGNTLNVFGQPPFTTDTSATTEYDDYKHRIDAFTTLTFAKAQPNETYQASSVRAVMGFDATISGNRKVITEKLTRCSNDRQTPLPFGFSQIKYYVNNRSVSRQLLVPRYVIGISGQRVQDLQEMARVERQNGKITDMRFNTGQSAMTRFMVLSEIRAQNELYKAMLPDQLDTPMLKKAGMSLDVISQQLNGALDQCIDRLARLKWVMGDAKLTPQTAQTPEEREELRQYVQQRVMDYWRREFTEGEEEKARRRNGGFLPSDFQPNPAFSDTYVQIMQCTQRLTDAAKQGKLNSHRKVMAHTEPFMVPGK